MNFNALCDGHKKVDNADRSETNGQTQRLNPTRV